MQPLDLNLASRPFRNNMPLWTAYALGALILGGLTIWNVHTFVDYGQRFRDLDDRLSSVQRKLAELEAREAQAKKEIASFDLKILGVQAEKANDVVRRRALSWTKLFNLLEKLLPYEVKMSSIRPLYGRKRDAGAEGEIAQGYVPVSVEGTAQGIRAFAEYEQNLISDPHFAQVEPQSTTFGKNGELIFDLRFLYAPEGEPGTPDEVRAASGAEAEDETGAEPGAGEPPADREASAPEEMEDGEVVENPGSLPEGSPEAASFEPAASAAPRAPVLAPASSAAGRPGAINTEPTAEELERAKDWKPFQPLPGEEPDPPPKKKGRP